MLDLDDLDFPLVRERLVSWVLALAVAAVAYLVLALVRRLMVGRLKDEDQA